MFFTQTDAAVGELALSRTYDTVRRSSGRYGVFGPGWNASIDVRLRVLSAKVIEARLADGRPQYYNDPDGDGRYDGVLPYTQESWLETIDGGAGGYKRVHRIGAFETFDALGRLVSFTDAVGVVTAYTRDGSGRLATVTRRGRSLVFVYDTNTTQMTRVQGPNGIVLASYTYTSGGVLDSVTYPDGSGYRFVYDAHNRIVSITDASGHVVERHEYESDSSNRATTSEIGDGREKLTFTYGTDQTTVTDALGNATVYDIAMVRHMPRIVRRTGPCASCGGTGETEQWTYDEFGRIAEKTDAGGTITAFTYNEHDDILTETQAAGTSLERTTTHSYTYDGARILTMTTTAPDGSVTTTTYGLPGPTRVDQQVSASETRTTTMTYTAEGQLETIKDPRGQTTGKVTTFGYNATGDLTSTTDPLMHTTAFGYDDLGRRTSATDPLSHTTTTTYDAVGRITRITAHDGTHTDFAYDKDGRRTSVTDPAGQMTRYVYDDYGWLTQVVDPAGAVTAYGYDLMGRMASLTDANGNTTSFEYDEYGRVEKVTYPGGASETFAYDGAGRLQTKAGRKGVVTSYAYDDLGRLTGKTYSDGTTPPVTYNYDENSQIGRLTSASNGTGGDTLTWTYNWGGELVSEQSTRNGTTVAYTYEADGNRLTVRLDGVLHVTYGYDDASRLNTITRGSAVFGFGYDDANRQTSMTYPNGINTVYGYDDLNRLLNLSAVHVPTSTTITNFTYTYDAASNRTSKQTLDFTETYGYDKLYQLTGVDRTGTPAKRWGFTYDPVGNRLSNQMDNSVATATYNEKNQLLSQGAGGPVRWRGQLDEVGTVTFTSATVNGKPARKLPGNIFEADLDMQPGTNLVTLQATDPSNNTRTQQYSVDVSGDGATYTYDANGNLETKVEGAGTWHYTWNAENQLVKVEKNGVEVARFAYDPIGRRVEKGAGGVTTSWTYDDEDILRETVGSVTVRYIYGLGFDEPLAREDGTGARTDGHADALGSIAKMTSDAGLVVQTRQYDAWGNPEAGADLAGHAFTGREWDPDAMLYHYRARYYSPSVGRFLSEDPIDYANGRSRYAYVLGQPTALVDPSGLSVCDKSCPTDIKNARRDLCNFASTIQDAHIRQCIESKCKDKNNKITCNQNHKDCKGGSVAYTQTANKMLMCPTNTMPTGGCWKRVIAHEMWIHECRPGGPAEPNYGLHVKKRDIIKKIVSCP